MTTPLIHHDGRILAALDVSVYAASVVDHAGWAASRVAAPLELLHAIERGATPATGDLSGNLTLGAREELLSSLTEIDEQRGRLAQEQGRRLLDDARTRLAAAYPGLPTTAVLRQGGLVETLLAHEHHVRLFVLGKRGEHADFARGHLGSNLERVMRAVHRPVLVAARAFRPIERFMIAFDGSPTTRKCVEMVAASPLLAGLPCVVLTVGEANDGNAGAMDWARTKLEAAGYAPQTLIVPGPAEAVIAQNVADRGIGLLVMGAYGHSRIRTMIVGSTTTQVLRSCQVPVLLLR
jgi:nucleotide-binding universal stress UspA family protein